MPEPCNGHDSQQVWQHDCPQYCPVFPPRWSHSVTLGTPQCIPWQPQESHIWRYSIALLGPRGCRALQTDWRLSPHTFGHMASPSISQDETQCGHILEALGTRRKLECSNNKPVISHKEFGIPKNPAVLEDLLTSTNKDMFDLLNYLSGIAIPSYSFYIMHSLYFEYSLYHCS